jgi:hypothetical protein
MRLKVIEHWSVRDDLGQVLQLGLLDRLDR